MRLENTFQHAPSVGAQTERTLWEEGVTHWDEFDPALVGDKRAEYLEYAIDEAREALDSGDVAYFGRHLKPAHLWRAYENFAETTAFLDIETTGLDSHRSDVTTVSVHREDETRTLVRGRDLDAETLAGVLEPADLLVTFNGKRFDIPFLEDNYPIDVTIPHIDLMYDCKRIGLSGGLKAIERQLGIERDLPDVDGREAVRLWRRYQRGDEGALETLVRYNRADTVNMRPLLETVVDRLDHQEFRPYVPAEAGGD